MSDPAWLELVRARARLRMLWCRELWSRHRYADEQALAITHGEVDRALLPARDVRDREREFLAADPEARAIVAELTSRDRAQADPRWARLLKECELSEAEAALLACALAAEVQPSLRRVYGYVQDDVAALDASPALVADLWQLAAPPLIGIDSQLIRWRLARPLETGREPQSSTSGWVADPALLDHLLDRGVRVSTGEPLAAIVPAPADPVLFPETLERIVEFVSSLSAPDSPSLEIELVAPEGTGRATLAAQAAQRLGRELMAVDSRQLTGLADPVTAAIRELRSAHLAGALIAFENADLLPAPALLALGELSPLLFLTVSEQHQNPPAAGALRRSYELPELGRARRLELWSAIATGAPPAPVRDWGLRAREVVAAMRAATAGPESVRDICKRLLFESPRELARPLALPYVWEELIVSDHVMAHLREFEAQATARSEVIDGWGLGRLAPLGRGVSAMFAGPSGTGKTMAAQVLARSLGLELLRIDLAGIVNKYIGETEKHLRAVFASCERAPVMLFFDEADALFGKRMQVGDAHDRFANIEVDYLLQRMEEFDGVAVLATNRKGDIDTAFLRRLRFVIDFAPPTADERERLWRLALDGSRDADGRTLVAEIDWAALARDLDLTGAGIKASALAAAFLARSENAPIGHRHIIAAARRELQKQGVVVRVGQLERGDPDHAGAEPGNGRPPLSAREVETMFTGGAG